MIFTRHYYFTNKKFWVMTLGMMMVLFSCADDQVVDSIQPESVNYFPLSSGSWIIYQIDSTGYQTSGCQEVKMSTRYQLKEEVDSSFLDGTNQLTYRILRYKRGNESLPWEFANVWTAKADNKSAQRVEENIRYIKMSFPVDSRTTWNGNAYNLYDEEIYRYGTIHTPYALNGLQFDSTAEVIQYRLDDSLIFKIDKTERYAKGVGLIYKIIDSTYNYINCGQFLDTSTGLTRFRKSGITYKQQILEYGN
jgi:hypothetical protein